MDVSAIKDIIIHGKGAMPAASVNEEQANAIAAYVDGTLKGH
jgi:mono/diheme cytochrome c family protein